MNKYFLILHLLIWNTNSYYSQVSSLFEIKELNLSLETQVGENDSIYIKCSYVCTGFEGDLMSWDSNIMLDSLKFWVNQTETIVEHSSRQDHLYLKLPKKVNDQDVITVHFYYPLKSILDPSRWGGVYNQEGYWFNMGVGMQNIPHSFGRAWFPTIDNFNVKFPVFFQTKCAPEQMFSCSGLMTKNQVEQEERIQQFELNEKVPAYLINFVLANQVVIESTYDSPLQRKELPIRIFTPENIKHQTEDRFGSLPLAMDVFEKAYGMYRFPQIGYSLVPFYSGAMEHACNISFPIYSIEKSDLISFQRLMAHELSHHWWGNNTTCAKAEEMWLNEGWAAYSEWEFMDKIYGQEEYWNLIHSEHDLVLNHIKRKDGGLHLMNEIPLERTYGMHSYKKGADIIRSLRYLLGDSLFYKFCMDFQREYAFQNVSTEMFLDYLSPFFNNKTQVFEQFDQWYFKNNFYPDLDFVEKSGQYVVQANGQKTKDIQFKWVIFEGVNKISIIDAERIPKSKKQPVSLHPLQYIADNGTGKLFTIKAKEAMQLRNLGITSIQNHSDFDKKIQVKRKFNTYVDTIKGYELLDQTWAFTTFDDSDIDIDLSVELPENWKYNNIKEFKVFFKSNSEGVWRMITIEDRQMIYDHHLRRLKVAGLDLKNGIYTFAKIKA